MLRRTGGAAHVTEFEGQPHRRPLTYDEVQALFDAADGRVEQIRSRGRKGALAAQRAPDPRERAAAPRGVGPGLPWLRD